MLILLAVTAGFTFIMMYLYLARFPHNFQTVQIFQSLALEEVKKNQNH